MPKTPPDQHEQTIPPSSAYTPPQPSKEDIEESLKVVEFFKNYFETEQQKALLEKERQRNKFRMPFAVGYVVSVVLWAGEKLTYP